MDRETCRGEPLPGGAGPQPRAFRVGGTVHRPAGRWTPAVHGVLAHLAACGFDGAPRVLGFDEQGREILAYVEGRAGVIPLPGEFLTGDGLATVAQLLRRYHQAIASYRPPQRAVWAAGQRPAGPGEIVLHIDNGPWNTIWRHGRAVAFVDWDLAQPGPPILDVAYGCWLNVPLADDQACRDWGFDPPPDRRQRLRVFCEAYGAEDVGSVLGVLEREQLDRVVRTERLALLGWQPWTEFSQLGLPNRDRRAAAWLRDNRDALQA